jgi:hypothetical protein
MKASGYLFRRRDWGFPRNQTGRRGWGGDRDRRCYRGSSRGGEQTLSCGFDRLDPLLWYLLRISSLEVIWSRRRDQPECVIVTLQFD